MIDENEIIELIEKNRKSPKKLVLDIPEDWHQEIKIRAARRNIPIRAYVLRAVMRAIKTEQQYEKDK